jgi:hypothetical protein
MPKLSCWSCGRQIYTVSPLESLFPEERRCPRCGAYLNRERRETERRVAHRRVNPAHDPGPPKPKAVKATQAAAKPTAATKPAAKAKAKAKGRSVKVATGDDPELAPGERRVAVRRTKQRRGKGPTPQPDA